MAKTREQDMVCDMVCDGAFRELTGGEWRTTQRPVYGPLWDLVYWVAIAVKERPGDPDPAASPCVRDALEELLGTVQDAVTRQLLSVLAVADGAALSREMDRAVRARRRELARERARRIAEEDQAIALANGRRRVMLI